jgi:hypothetical protein
VITFAVVGIASVVECIIAYVIDCVIAYVIACVIQE